MLPIDIKHIKYNFGTSGTKKIYIVVHDTGNTGRGADDISHYKYFDGGVRNASAHYFVDKDSITETVNPLKDSWHCGDGAGKYGITNRNSIGVEICINSDGDYAKSVSNTVELVKYLMRKFGIDLDHVVTHNKASGKNCPATMSANSWAKWIEFKARVRGGTVATELQNGSQGSKVVDLQTKLNFIGYNCGIADGYFGKGTFTAVEAFQKAKGLLTDGIVGSSTMAALNAAVTIKNIPVVKPVPIPAVATPMPAKHLYRVRKIWEDVKGQIGAYEDLQGAKELADKNADYSVFDESGKVVYKYVKPVPIVVKAKTLEERLVDLEIRMSKLESGK